MEYVILYLFIVFIVGFLIGFRTVEGFNGLDCQFYKLGQDQHTITNAIPMGEMYGCKDIENWSKYFA